MPDITREQRENLLEPMNRLQHKPKQLVDHILSLTDMMDFGLGTDFLDCVREYLPRMANKAGDLPAGVALLGIRSAAIDFADQLMREAIFVPGAAVGEECVMLRGKRLTPFYSRTDLWAWLVPNREPPHDSTTVCTGYLGTPAATARHLVEHELMEQVTVAGLRILDPHAILAIGQIIEPWDLKSEPWYCEGVDVSEAPTLPFGLILPEEVEYRLRRGPQLRSGGSAIVRFQERWKIPQDALDRLNAD